MLLSSSYGGFISSLLSSLSSLLSSSSWLSSSSSWLSSSLSSSLINGITSFLFPFSTVPLPHYLSPLMFYHFGIVVAATHYGSEKLLDRMSQWSALCRFVAVCMLARSSSLSNIQVGKIVGLLLGAVVDISFTKNNTNNLL